MALEPGMFIGQKVRLLREIARGGMGSVWVGEHLSLRTQVAVKFMAPELASYDEAVTRFTREATAAAQIKSQHVIRIFDHGRTDEGLPYIVMEMLEGEDLERRIERLGPLEPAQVVLIVRQVCRALSRAHESGIVHRDIKPENIFLVDTDVDLFVKVVDFGVAKRNETPLRATWSGVTVGTPCYMSPEQVQSARDVDFNCDLWSVAVVAYQALTGHLPFAAATVGAICIAIDKGQFTPPSTLRPELGPAVDAWFARALARDLQARFGSAREMADAFEHAVLGTTTPHSTAPPPPPAPRRRLWLIPFTAILALFGAGLAKVTLSARADQPVMAPAAQLVHVAPIPPGEVSSVQDTSAARGPDDIVVRPESPEKKAAPASGAESRSRARPIRRQTLPSSARRSVVYSQPAVVPRHAPAAPAFTQPAAPTSPPAKDRGF